MKPQFPEKWFKGVTLGSLDGTIVTESIESGSTTMALRLTVSDSVVECDCPTFEPSDISPYFGKRVRVNGRVSYNGETGLPSKIEILELPRPIKATPDIARWRGAFGLASPPQ